MRWAVLEFTHYTTDEALAIYEPSDYSPMAADTLADAVAAITPLGMHLARIDDHDTPYGGVFTNARYARRYDILNDWTRSNLLCYALVAEYACDPDWFQAMLTAPKEVPA